MSWSDVWKICISIVGALGGLSVILVAIVRYMSSIIAAGKPRQADACAYDAHVQHFGLLYMLS